MSLQHAADLMKQQPVIAAIRHGGESLASNLFLPEYAEVGCVIFAYNGGELDADGFTLVEYIQSDEHCLEVVLLRHSPELTAAEKAALNAVPQDQRTRSVGNVAPENTVVAAGAVLVASAAVYAVAYVAACSAYCYLTPEEVHLSDEEIQRLGPSASARELIHLRRTAMLQMNG